MVDNGNLDTTIYTSDDLSELKKSLKIIKQLQIRTEYGSKEHVNLLHLECVVLQRIYEKEDLNKNDAQSYLNRALNCTIQIEKIFSKFPIVSTLNPLACLHERACIICELGRFKNRIKCLNEALSLFEYIRENEQNDQQLRYLTIMNEAKIRIELALNNINPLQNCIKSLKLSEKARNFFDENDHRHEITFINQHNALVELCKLESFGFEIEAKEILKKIANKIDLKLNPTKIKIDLDLIELGIKSITELDVIIDHIEDVSKNFDHHEHEFNELIILKGDALLKKSVRSKDKVDKILDLNSCITYIDNNCDFNEKYYTFQAFIIKAKAKIELSKVDSQRKIRLLNEACKLLTKIKNYFEENLLEHDYNYFLALLYLSKTKKEKLVGTEFNKKEYENIEKMLLKSLNYFKNNNYKDKLIECYFELSELYYNFKDYAGAYFHLNNCIKLIELMRSSISDFELRKIFFEKYNNIFELMILTCHHLNKNGEALKFIELRKNRTILDKIIKNQKKYSIKPIDKKLIYELDKNESRIQMTLFKLKNCDKFDFKISEYYDEFSKLKKIEKKYLLKIKKEFPEYYDYYYNYYFDYTKINLQEKNLIEYYYNEDIVLIFLIRNTELIVKNILLNTNELTTNINNFKDKIEESLNLTDYNICFLLKIDEIMEKLFSILIKPIQNEITSNDLIIIPYKELHNIPFYCLKENMESKYLIDDYLITIAQSGTSIKYLENNPYIHNNQNLVIGIQDEKLTHTKEESIFVSVILNTTPFINENATKNNILNEIENKQIIHYAGHGCFDNLNPINSYLKLYDEKLFIKDLNRKNINSELIVLSACETGIVSIENTEETESFVSYLHIGGVKYIIASLWPVFDDATLNLFKHFYTLDEDYPKRLRLAQLELKKTKNLLQWGGFQIYGL